jgi:hypothetical protein
VRRSKREGSRALCRFGVQSEEVGGEKKVERLFAAFSFSDVDS